MKTINLFILILIFSMVSLNAFAHGGGVGSGGVGDGGSGSANVTGSRSKNPYKFLKGSYKDKHNTRSGPLLGGAYPPMVDKHWKKAITYLNKHSTQKPKKNQKADGLDKAMGKKLGELVTIIHMCEPDKSPKDALGLATLLFMLGMEY